MAERDGARSVSQRRLDGEPADEAPPIPTVDAASPPPAPRSTSSPPLSREASDLGLREREMRWRRERARFEESQAGGDGRTRGPA